MKYKLVIFDWDGTLFDSGAYIVKQFQKAASALNLAIPEAKTIRKAIGMNLDYVIDQIMPDIPEAQIAPFVKTFRHNMQHSTEQTPTLFEGAEKVLENLHDQGYMLAVATGKRRAHFDQDASAVGVAPLFSTSRCGDETLSKPHPQMVEEILGELNVLPKEALMVGDTEYDVQAGLGAGSDAIGVSYGMHKEADLRRHPILHCLSDIRDLPAWLVDSWEAAL